MKTNKEALKILKKHISGYRGNIKQTDAIAAMEEYNKLYSAGEEVSETKAIQKQDEKYHLACQNCGTTSKPLQMIPFRNDNHVVGLLTCCDGCKDELYGQRFDRESKFKKLTRPTVSKKSPVRFYTFDQFVKYGLEHSDNIVAGMPWSFEIHGHPVTHETDECYIVPTENGMENFTPKDMLMFDINGDLQVHEIPKQEQLEPEGIREATNDEIRDAFEDTTNNSKPYGTTNGYINSLKSNLWKYGLMITKKISPLPQQPSDMKCKQCKFWVDGCFKDTDSADCFQYSMFEPQQPSDSAGEGVSDGNRELLLKCLKQLKEVTEPETELATIYNNFARVISTIHTRPVVTEEEIKNLWYEHGGYEHYGELLNLMSYEDFKAAIKELLNR